LSIDYPRGFNRISNLIQWRINAIDKFDEIVEVPSDRGRYGFIDGLIASAIPLTNLLILSERTGFLSELAPEGIDVTSRKRKKGERWFRDGRAIACLIRKHVAPREIPLDDNLYQVRASAFDLALQPTTKGVLIISPHPPKKFYGQLPSRSADRHKTCSSTELTGVTNRTTTHPASSEATPQCPHYINHLPLL